MASIENVDYLSAFSILYIHLLADGYSYIGVLMHYYDYIIA